MVHCYQSDSQEKRQNWKPSLGLLSDHGGRLLHRLGRPLRRPITPPQRDEEVDGGVEVEGHGDILRLPLNLPQLLLLCLRNDIVIGILQGSFKVVL